MSVINSPREGAEVCGLGPPPKKLDLNAFPNNGFYFNPDPQERGGEVVQGRGEGSQHKKLMNLLFRSYPLEGGTDKVSKIY